jgi:hypothetical protein
MATSRRAPVAASEDLSVPPPGWTHGAWAQRLMWLARAVERDASHWPKARRLERLEDAQNFRSLAERCRSHGDD